MGPCPSFASAPHGSTPEYAARGPREAEHEPNTASAAKHLYAIEAPGASRPSAERRDVSDASCRSRRARTRPTSPEALAMVGHPPGGAGAELPVHLRLLPG